MAIMVDTGPLFAIADASDRHHKKIADCLASTEDVLVVPVTVLPEVSYLVNRYLSPDVEVRLLRSVVSGEGSLCMEGVTKADLSRAVEVIDSMRTPRWGWSMPR